MNDPNRHYGPGKDTITIYGLTYEQFSVINKVFTEASNALSGRIFTLSCYQEGFSFAETEGCVGFLAINPSGREYGFMSDAVDTYFANPAFSIVVSKTDQVAKDFADKMEAHCHYDLVPNLDDLAIFLEINAVIKRVVANTPKADV